METVTIRNPRMFPFPAIELAALYSLYNATNGPLWVWTENIAGQPWNFTQADPNPCADQWYGIECTSNCDTEPCHVKSLILVSTSMVGEIPPSIGDLQYLVELDLFDNGLFGTLPTEISSLSKLSTLILSSNSFTGTIPSEYGLLKSLNLLYLSYNSIQGPIPSELSQLENLQSLEIQSSHLSGTLPPELGRLRKLQDLDLSYNDIHGSIPSSYVNLSSLEYFDVIGCSLTGTISPSTALLGDLLDFYANDNYLTGSIPPEIFTGCSQLTAFYISGNHLNGTIPSTISAAPRLETLLFQSNELSGSIPEAVCDLVRLSSFEIDNNHLTGSIPSCIGNLIRLYSLSIGRNYLTGSVPQSMINLFRLVLVQVDNNMFSSTLPAFLAANVTQLGTFNADNNRFTGTIPLEFGQLAFLEGLYLQGNLFTGPMPFQVTNVKQYPGLTKCDLSNNFFGNTIPADIGEVTTLYYLGLYNNLLSGEIPAALSNMHNMQSLLLNDNFLEGPFPSSLLALKHLKYCNISGNHFSGSLPYAISSLTQLGYFDISHNLFEGSVPPGVFSQASGLIALRMNDNRLTGRLDGLVNPALQSKLVQIDIGTNEFSGTLPLSLFLLPSLVSFVASVNHFSGTLSSEICDYPLSNLTTLILDGMHAARRIALPWVVSGDDDSNTADGTYLAEGMQGTLPTCLLTGETFPSLMSLHLSGTSIYDELPSDIVLSKKLNDLALAHNIMYGTIPHNFQSHPWTNLDLSFNRLSGTLSEEYMSAMYAQNDSSLTLQINRLSGRVPTALIKARNVNILTGNLFTCSDTSSRGEGVHKTAHLPSHDPSYVSYECGSDYTNYALIIWTILLASLVSVLVWAVGYCGGCGGWQVCGKKAVPTTSIGDEKFSVEEVRSPPSLTVFSGTIVSQMKQWRSIFQQDAVTGVSIEQLNALSRLMSRLLLQLTRLVLLLLVVFMPVYAILTNYYGTYTHQYVWSVSISFLQGLTPAVVLLILLTGLVYGIMSVLQLEVAMMCMGPQDAQYDESIRQGWSVDEVSSVPSSRQPSIRLSDFKWAVGGTGDRNESISNVQSVDDGSSLWCCWYGNWRPFLLVIGIVISNCVVVLVVNGLYVFSTQKHYSVRTLAVISFLISIFKLVWGNVVVISGVGHYLAASLVVTTTSPSTSHSVSNVKSKPYLSETGQLLLLIMLSLFNNIVAPYLAEAFVSSNCFKYVITASPLQVSSFRSVNCIVTSFNNTQSMLECASTSLKVDISATAVSSDFETPGIDSVRFQPPFIYNFTCSSSLLTAFAYVFVYRYLLSGLVQPVICWAVKHLQQRALLRILWLRLKPVSSSNNDDLEMTTRKRHRELLSWQDQFRLWTDLLPLLWRPIAPELKEELRSAANIVTDEILIQLTDDILVCNLAIASGCYHNIDFTQLQLGSWAEDQHDVWRRSTLDVDAGNRSGLSFLPSNRDSNLSSSQTSRKLDRRQRKHAEKLVLLKKAFVVRMLCDFAVLLSFAVLFPPLSVVILTSMVSEGAQLLLSLGRFVCIVEAATTPAAIAAGSMSSLQTLLHTINADFRGLVADKWLVQSLQESPIMTSFRWSSLSLIQMLSQKLLLAPRLQRVIFIALCFAALFWSFSLFDTLGDQVGVYGALWMIAVMALSPIWLQVLRLLSRYLWRGVSLVSGCCGCSDRADTGYVSVLSPLLVERMVQSDQDDPEEAVDIRQGSHDHDMDGNEEDLDSEVFAGEHLVVGRGSSLFSNGSQSL